MNYKLRDSSKTIMPIKSTGKITKDGGEWYYLIMYNGIMPLQPI